MSVFFATPKLPSSKLGGPITNDPTHPTFTGLTLGQWKFLFNYWKEYLIENTSPLLFPKDMLVALTLTLISFKLTGKLSPLSPVLEEMFDQKNPDMVASEPTI